MSCFKVMTVTIEHLIFHFSRKQINHVTSSPLSGVREACVPGGGWRVSGGSEEAAQL